MKGAYGRRMMVANLSAVVRGREEEKEREKGKG